MIRVIATITCQSDCREQVLAAIRDNLPAVHAEDGCREYAPAIDVPSGIPAQGTLRDHIIIMVEAWDSLAHLEAHLAAPHMASFRERVKDLVTSVELQVLDDVTES